MYLKRRFVYIFIPLVVIIWIYLKQEGYIHFPNRYETCASMLKYKTSDSVISDSELKTIPKTLPTLMNITLPFQQMLLIFYDGSNDSFQFLVSAVTLFRKENVAVVTTTDFMEKCYLLGILCLDMTITNVRDSTSSVKYVEIHQNYDLCRLCSIYTFLKSGIEIIAIDPTFTCIQDIDIWSVFTDQDFNSYCSNDSHYNVCVVRIKPSTQMLNIFRKACEISFNSAGLLSMSQIMLDLIEPVLNEDSCSTDIRTSEYLVERKVTGNIKCLHITSELNKQTIQILKGQNMWHFTNRIRNYGNDEQTMFVYYFRTAHQRKIYPLDVKYPKGFHTIPRFGLRRGTSIARYYLHKWMEDMVPRFTEQNTMNACLEVGDGHFFQTYFKTVCKSKISLDLYDPRATIKGNLESPQIKLFDSFDIIICAFVLEHVNYPQKAMDGMYKMLKRNGIIFLVVPFITPVHSYPDDISRFSTHGINVLAQNANLSIISMETYGNSLTTIGFMLEMCAEDFSQYELEKKDKHQYLAVYSILKKI